MLFQLLIQQSVLFVMTKVSTEFDQKTQAISTTDGPTCLRGRFRQNHLNETRQNVIVRFSQTLPPR